MSGLPDSVINYVRTDTIITILIIIFIVKIIFVIEGLMHKNKLFYGLGKCIVK